MIKKRFTLPYLEAKCAIPQEERLQILRNQEIIERLKEHRKTCFEVFCFCQEEGRQS